MLVAVLPLPDADAAAPSSSATADVDLSVWGDNVRYWRSERHLTQTELAVTLGMTQSAVSEIENGRRRPTDQQRIATARVLDVPYTQLFPFPRDVR